MKYFNKVTSRDEAKALFRKLAKEHHPDVGGSNEIMRDINTEFACIMKIMGEKREHTETFIREFYTDNGWKGSRYNINLSTGEITKIVRDYVKEIHNDCRFSVTCKHYSSIHVYLQEAPFPAIKDGSSEISLNKYHLDNNKQATAEALKIMIDINNFIKSFHYSDCDSMIDYFHVNFYYSLGIGQWNKPFKVVPRVKKPSKLLNVA